MSSSVLVVDPSKAAATRASSLRGLSVEPSLVSTLVQARLKLATTRFDAVVISLAVPGWLDLLASLRAVSLPVLLTGSYQALLEAREAGAVYFLEDPVQAEDLARAVLTIGGSKVPAPASTLDMAWDAKGLTPKERDVARLVVKGLSTPEIAKITGNSQKTLKNHIAAIFKKFNVESRAQLFHALYPT